MSVTQCRSCDQPITFVLRDDGRWRPVEVTFEELAAEGDEFLSIQKTGSWQVITGTVRVYKAHRCIEDPSWNQGRPKLTVRTDVGTVDVATGELRGLAHDDEDLLDDDDQPLTGAALANALAKQQERDREWREWQAERTARKARARQKAEWREAAKASPWPPEPGGYGYDQLREWLTAHASVLTGESE